MKKSIQIFILCHCFVFSGLCVFAQSTIFNTPSTGVMSEKTFAVEGSFVSHLDKWENGGFQTFGYRMIYGVRKNTEVGANFFYTRNGGTSLKEVQLNAKYKVLESEKYGIAVATGVQLYVPLRKNVEKPAFGMFYTTAGKTIKQTGGTRVTTGFYQMVGAPKEFGTKRGMTLGIEQPIKGKFSFTADWLSGKNNFGYSAAGLNYALTKKQFLTVGYNFGNAGRGNNGLGIYYFRTF